MRYVPAEICSSVDRRLQRLKNFVDPEVVEKARFIGNRGHQYEIKVHNNEVNRQALRLLRWASELVHAQIADERTFIEVSLSSKPPLELFDPSNPLAKEEAGPRFFSVPFLAQQKNSEGIALNRFFAFHNGERKLKKLASAFSSQSLLHRNLLI